MKGIIYENIYYSSIGTGMEGVREGERRGGGRKKENKFKNYVNVLQQETGQINLWCIYTIEYYEVIILLRFIYPNLE